MEKIIQITNLEKKFGQKTVLKNINWIVYQGERVAVLGANGAGKTTLVEMIGQISKPNKGEIKINLPGNIKTQIGIQFQKGEWIIGLTPKDLLNFYHYCFPEFNYAREEELSAIFEIDEFKKTNLTRLSGGQQQRFNAMLSVLNKPKLIILDELTVGLDMQLQFKILNFFKETTQKEKKTTLLLVSHNPEEVEMLCTRMIIIGQESILFDDSISNVQKKYGSVRNLMNRYFGGTLNVENENKEK